MANVQSNPISEYDFAEELDQELNEHDPPQNNFIQQMEPNLLMILNGFQLSNEVMERFAASGIRYSQLASLSHEDLSQLGISDRTLQDDILLEFQSLLGQDPHLRGALHHLAEGKAAAKQEMSVIDLVQNQLLNMNMLLAATIIKVGASQTSQSPGVVVNNNFNSPQVVLGLLSKMSSHTDEIIDLIRQLKNEREMNEKKEELQKKTLKDIAIKSVIIASGVVISFFIAKYLKVGKKLF